MRKARTRVVVVTLFCCAFLSLQSAAKACSRTSPISRDEMFFEADSIVRVTAVKYVAAPPENIYTTGIPDSTVEFKVEEVLSGKGLPSAVVLNGYLSDSDDFNDRPVPYDFVRPGGRGGSCYANSYKRGAQFLLFLKKGDAGTTPYWDALAPTNEQLKSADDPWLIWSKEYIRSSTEHPSPEMELRKLTRMWDEAIVKHDAEALGRLLDDGYSIPYFSKEAYISLVTSEYKFTYARKSGISVRLYGDTAVLSGLVTLKREGDDSSKQPTSSSFMDVWVKQQGQWRCIATMTGK